MSTYSNRLQPALLNLLQRVVWFFHPKSSCTTMHISADVQRITLSASSCMTISGERAEQLDIFCLIADFTSDFCLPQMSADICMMISGERTEQHVVIGFGELATVD